MWAKSVVYLYFINLNKEYGNYLFLFLKMFTTVNEFHIDKNL